MIVRPSKSGAKEIRASQWYFPHPSRAKSGTFFAPFIRAYIRRSGAPEDICWKVAVKDRLNRAKNPYAHPKLADITTEWVWVRASDGRPTRVPPALIDAFAQD